MLSGRTKWFLFVLAAFVYAVVTAGCGGSGGGSGSSNSLSLVRTPVQAVINLPASAPTNMSNLRVWTSAGISKPDASGHATAVIFNNGPQYVDARDSSGNLVVAGYLGQGKTTLDATTTAQTLIFVALGGLAQIDKGPETVLKAVPDLTGFSGIVSEVQAQIKANGYVDLTVGTLKDDIEAIVTAFRAAQGRGLIAEPTSSSGLFLNTSEEGSIKIQNNFLRRLVGQLKRVSYVDADGTEVKSTGKLVKFDIDSPSRYGGLTGTISGIILGDLTWTPIVTPPIATPLYPTNARSTTYELTTLGLGANPGIENQLTTDQTDELNTVMLKGFVLDVILPPLCNIILPLNGDGIDDFLKYSNGSTIMTDIISNLTGTAPGLVDQIRQGDFKGAVRTVYNAALTSNSAVPLVLHLMQAYAEEHGDKALLDGLGDQSEEISGKLAKLGFVDIFFSSIDMAILVHDFNASNRADKFTITVNGQQKITVTADRPATCVSEPLALTAVVQNKPSDATFRYEWTVSSGFRLDAQNGSTEGAPNGVLVTSSETVNLRPIKDQTGQATVACTVKKIVNNETTPIDTDTRQFTILPDPEVTPIPAKIKPNEKISLHATYPGQETPLWKFTLNSPNMGTINRTAIGNNPDVEFTSNGTLGVAVIGVEMYIPINGQSVKVCTYLKDITVGSDTYPVNYLPIYKSPISAFGIVDGVQVEVIGYVKIPKEFEPDVVKYFLVNSGNQSQVWDSWTPAGSPRAQAKLDSIFHDGNNYWYVQVGGGAPRLFQTMAEAEAYYNLVVSVQGAEQQAHPPLLIKQYAP